MLQNILYLTVICITIVLIFEFIKRSLSRRERNQKLAAALKLIPSNLKFLDDCRVQNMSPSVIGTVTQLNYEYAERELYTNGVHTIEVAAICPINGNDVLVTLYVSILADESIESSATFHSYPDANAFDLPENYLHLSLAKNEKRLLNEVKTFAKQIEVRLLEGAAK